MRVRRLWKFMAATVLVGAGCIVTAAPSSAEPHLCGYVITGGVEAWSEPCGGSCSEVLVDNGTDPNTDWTYLCLQP